MKRELIIWVRGLKLECNASRNKESTHKKTGLEISGGGVLSVRQRMDLGTDYCQGDYWGLRGGNSGGVLYLR